MAQGSPAGAKPSGTDNAPETLKAGDGNCNMEGRPGPGRAVPAVATHPLIAPAYAHLQSHQLLPQPPAKHPQPQFVAQQQPQPPRPAPQVQSQPQLASVSPSLALQSSPEDHALPLGSVTQALPLQCSTTHVHKPGNSQQCHLPTLDTGSQNGHPEGGSHPPQRRFQHTSAVILQVQPASPVTPQQCAPDDWKEVVPAEKSVPVARPGPSPHQQAIIPAIPGGLPGPKSPNIQQCPAHGMECWGREEVGFACRFLASFSRCPGGEVNCLKPNEATWQLRSWKQRGEVRARARDRGGPGPGKAGGAERTLQLFGRWL